MKGRASSGPPERAQVMTRQPAAEKRLTVACPIPRLAPVSSMMRREVFDDEAMGTLMCDR